jgi:hypothetical protein
MAFPPQNLAWLPQWYGSCETAKGCCLTWVLKMDGSLPHFTTSCVNCLCHSPTLCHHPPSESEQDAKVTLAVQFIPHFSELITNYRPTLWSSAQSSWLQIQRARVRYLVLPDFLRSSGSGTGSTQPCEDNWGAIWMEK